MKIVKATKDHVVELAKLQKLYMQHHARLDEFFAFEDDMTEKWIAHVRKSIKRNDDLILIALDGPKIVGYMTAAVNTRAPVYRIKRTGFIGDNFVLPEYRRKAIFSNLLNRTLAWMKTKKIEYVEHPIAARNKLGRTVWKTKGFEDTTIITKRKIEQQQQSYP